MRPVTTCGISIGFPVLSPAIGKVAHVLLTRSPLGLTSLAGDKPSLDLHVLCAPPALTLSQDQTLRPKRRTQGFIPESSQTLRVFPTLQLSKCWLLETRSPTPLAGRTKPSCLRNRRIVPVGGLALQGEAELGPAGRIRSF